MISLRSAAGERWVIGFLCVLLIALNIGKALHIDDGWHIRAARWIAEHPFQPLSGTVQWSGYVQPFHEGNNPPLLFYGLALVGSVLQWNEWALHLFISLFGVLAIVLFRRITLLLGYEKGLLLTAVLAISPAFLVVQNLMLDLPLLALELWLLFLLLRGHQQRSTRDYVIAALVLGAAVLVKYSLLPLILVLGWSSWRTFGWKRWWILIIPIGIWVLWAMMNIAEFGRPHMIARTGALPGITGLLERLVTNVMILGSVLPVAAGIGIALIIGSRWLGAVTTLFFACIAALLVRVLVRPELGSGRELVWLFTTAGTLLCIGLIVRMIRARKREGHGQVDHAHVVIASSLLLLLAFNLAFAPFMAPRHVLLFLPLVLLLGRHAFTGLSARWSIAVIGATLVLSVWMAVSDIRYAGFYRETAILIAERYPERQRWHQGAWGWGWYSEQLGSTDLVLALSPPRSGDIIATAIFCVPDGLPEGLSAHAIDTVQQDLSFADLISTRHWAKFYCVKYLDTPWEFTMDHPEMVVIREVD